MATIHTLGYMTWILGISAYFHDAAAALVRDGEIVAAASEERFSRMKHDASFPLQAIGACLAEAGITLPEVDFVGFYEKPLLKFDRLLETFLAFAPKGFSSFRAAVPPWLKTKLHLPREFRRHLGNDFRKRLLFAKHHESHAASAFFPSPFDDAAILTVDGVGEWATTTWGTGCGNQIQLHQEIRFPHSLGLLYSAVTAFCGFRVNSGEYKLMGLAAKGTKRYVDLIQQHLIRFYDDGSFHLNMDYFGFGHRLSMTNTRFSRLIGAPPRHPHEPLRDIDRDLAASVQWVVEEAMLRLARHVHARTGKSRLCMAGGVALNCVANRRLSRESPFEQIWIQPAAGDAGGALGVALWIAHQLLHRPRAVLSSDAQRGSFLGPSMNASTIASELHRLGAVYERITDEAALLKRVAELLDNGAIIGWFQGRMEFGPRALGARSILADPRVATMQATLNERIKQREAFRPFAPAILQDLASQYFEIGEAEESPYMMLTYPAHGDDLPAVTHVDGSARVQTVDEARHGRFYHLLRAFHARTGCPALINTSFNVRGEPIVATVADAWQCFLAAGLDALVIDDYLMLRNQQATDAVHAAQAYLDRLEDD